MEDTVTIHFRGEMEVAACSHRRGGKQNTDCNAEEPMEMELPSIEPVEELLVKKMDFTRPLVSS